MLHSFDNVLVLPSHDPAFLARSALLLDGAGAAGVGHVTAQLLSVLHGSEGVVCTENSNPDVMMVKAAEDRV